MDAHADTAGFLFDGFRLDSRGGGLLRNDGSNWLPVAMGSRALAVLDVLAERHGELVPKQQIMDAVWPDTAVEDNNLTVQISALRRVLDEGRTGGSCIQTVPGRGYRFVAPVTRVDTAGDATADSPPGDAVQGGGAATEAHGTEAPPHVRRLSRRPIVAASLASCLLIAALLAAAVWHFRWSSGPAAPPRLSIVVLPFDNLSGDRTEDYLAEAITDELTTDLARIPGTFVIARQSAYSYQGKAVDLRKVGEDLGVRYALEGSVRRLGDVLRVNTQLVATETGAHLWADRFDQQLKDLSTAQEEVVRRIGQILTVALTDVESARSKRERPTNPDAFDLILRARSRTLHPMGPREHAEAISLLEQALRLDPTSILAMTRLADELILDRLNFGSTAGDALDRAARLIASAAVINPNDSGVLGSTALLLRAQDRYAEAIAAYQRVLHEYPNAYYAYSQIGMLLNFSGRVEEAIPMIETAIRRDPQGPGTRNYYENIGWALLMLGRDEESIVWMRRALAANPNHYPGTLAQYHLRIAAAEARLGHIDEAHRALAEANRLWPYDTVRGHYPDDPSNRVAADQIEHYQAALRLAGDRDHADEAADFGVASDDTLYANLAGLTPTTAPGVTTIRTAQLERLLAEQKPIVIDPLGHFWGRSLPGAVGLKNAGWGGVVSDAMQDRLRKKVQTLTKGDLSTKIVAVGFNSERFDGRNLALRLAALGYTNVYWYRGGREAWEVAGLPETRIDVQDW